MALYLLVLVYRDHITDVSRPPWLKLKGTRPHGKDLLRAVGIRRDWIEYLNVMTSMTDVEDSKIWKVRPVPKKRGPKPKVNNK